MEKEVSEELRIRRIWVVLEYARLCGNAAKACREFNVNRSSFYVWKKAFEMGGMNGLGMTLPQKSRTSCYVTKLVLPRPCHS